MTIAERYGLRIDDHHLGDTDLVENPNWRRGSSEPRGITPTAYTFTVTLSRDDDGALGEIEERVGLPAGLKLFLCECGLLMVSGLADQHRVHASVHEGWIQDVSC